VAHAVLKTYGTVTRAKNGNFQIACEPHVRIRLKNWLGGVAKARLEHVALADTDQNCRELLWFLGRYPMKMGAAVRKRLEGGSESQLERVESVTRILGGDFQIPSVAMALPARPYQEQAAAAVFNTGSLLLVDELSLGKTISAIRVMADKRALPALAVVPAPLTHQWADEIRRFVPGLCVHILQGGAPYDLAEKIGQDPHVIVTSYHKLAAWADHLMGKIKFIVFDEAQELRTGDKAAKNHAAALIAAGADYKLGLTGTPIYNYGGEIFNVLEVLSHGSLGNRNEFEREWCIGARPKILIEEPRAFGTHLREIGLMMRRTRDDVGQHLPELSSMVHNVDCNASSAFWDIGTSAAEMARIVLDNAAKSFDRMQASGFLDKIVRQATGVAKAPGVAALVRLIASQGEQIVLFGWHRAVYEIWKQLLSDLELAWYTGSESTAKKRKEVARFVAGDAKVLIMSLRSGLGLNGLQEVCATAVHGELDWSPQVHEQCNGRLHRAGQKRPVFAHYAIADSGSDPVVCDVLGIKRGQVEGLRNPDGAPVVQRQLDPEHIKRLAKDYLERFKAP
jgi:SNF2 family DNA or RNA helicase